MSRSEAKPPVRIIQDAWARQRGPNEEHGCLACEQSAITYAYRSTLSLVLKIVQSTKDEL
jgi:hypothetical protein